MTPHDIVMARAALSRLMSRSRSGPVQPVITRDGLDVHAVLTWAEDALELAELIARVASELEPLVGDVIDQARELVGPQGPVQVPAERPDGSPT